MSVLVLFQGENSLEFEAVRQQVLRIPEVVRKLREGQVVWDQYIHDQTDLVSLMGSSDENFFKSSSMKGLMKSLVQLGLYDRYVKKHGLPQYILGNIRNESATKVASGKASLEELIVSSRASGVEVKPSLEALPNLRGQLLPEYRVFHLMAGRYQEVGQAAMTPIDCLKNLAEEEGVRQVISIGPGSFQIPEKSKTGFMSEVTCQESIDMDPLLTWFWPQVEGVSRTA